MNAKSPLSLPGDFIPEKSYLLSGKTLMAWREALQRDRVVAGPGITESGTPQGRVLAARGEAAASTLRPFQIIPGEAGKIRVVPGYVNGVMATLGGTALTGIPAPQITVSGTVYVFVKIIAVFGSGGDTYTVQIVTGSDLSPPDGTDIDEDGYSDHYLLGSAVAGGAITNYATGGNLGAETFGNMVLWWVQ